MLFQVELRFQELDLLVRLELVCFQSLLALLFLVASFPCILFQLLVVLHRELSLLLGSLELILESNELSLTSSRGWLPSDEP